MRALWVVSIALAACSTEHMDEITDATAPAIDGGPLDGEALIIAEPAPPRDAAAPALPAEPAAAAPPNCAICDAPPNVDQSACAEDEARFPSSAACERIGSPCPLGQWAEDL